MAPARAVTSHRYGDASPSGAVSVVWMTGSGFHDGPSTVSRSRPTISRPQMIHAHGSYVGADGSSRLSAASTRLATTIATGSGSRSAVPRASGCGRGWVIIGAP